MKNKNSNLQLEGSNGSRTLFQHIVEDIEALPILVYEFKLDGKCVYINNACCLHFKRSKEFLLTQRMRDLSKTFSDGQLPDNVIDSLIAGNTLRFEDEHIISTGEHIPVEVALHCFTENDIRYAVVYCMNLRERKKIEQLNLSIQDKQARIDAESHFKRLVEAYPDPLVRTDLNGNITYAREDIASYFGYIPEKLYGQRLSDLTMSSELKVFANGLTKAAIIAAEDNEPYIYEEWAKFNGKKNCFEVRHIPERDTKGNVTGVLGFSRIVTSRVIQNEILQFLVQSNASTDKSFFDEMVSRLKDLFDVDCVALFLLKPNNVDLTIKSSSEPCFKDELSRFSIDSPLFQKTIDKAGLYYANNQDEDFPKDSFLAEHKIKNLICAPLLENGATTLGFLSIFSRSMIEHAGVIKNMMNLVANSIVSKIERIKYEEAEKSRTEDFRVLVEESPDYICRFDLNLTCTYVNEAIIKLGFSSETIVLDEDSNFKEQIKTVLATGISSTKIHRGTAPHVELYDVETRVFPESDKEGKIRGVLVIARDISDRVSLEEKLRNLADTDALTNLPNRRALTEQLNFAIANAKRQNTQLGLLFVDLDRFKTINDTLGHDMGDELLREAARRLQHVIRESDMVARFGGDEFVVLLTALKDPADIVKIAESIITALEQPFNLDVMTTCLSASVGIASFPNDSESASELIAHSDQAMYIAKQQGRNTYRFFTHSMQTDSDERLLMLNDLRLALGKNQLHVVFQPIIDSSNGQISKAEALVRWRHPEKGYIPPDKFIPLAEDSGLINLIGDWVFKESAELAKKWQQQSREEVQVSINISPRQFNQDLIATKWLNCLKEMDLSTKHITLEVTETLLLEDHGGLQTKIRQFRDAGVKFAIDDFGTGYSAMSYLKKFPIDYLKIDGSFIRDMTSNKNDLAIVETIAVMASRLGMKSIAECVETEEQNKLLLSFGCDYIQGHLYSKPLKKEAFLEFIQMQ